MEGKTITKTVDLSDGYTLVKFDDGEIGLFKVLVPDGLQADLLELMEGESEKASPKSDEKDETAGGDDAYTWADLLELSYKELKTLCRDNDLSTKPKDYDKDEVDDFREEVAKEIDVKIPDDKEKDDKGKDDAYTWEDLKDMDYEELEDLCDEEKLDTDPDDFDENNEEEEKFRKAIAKEMGISPPKPSKR